jgi:hypothetical protein
MRHQLALMCDDIQATIAELIAKGIDVKGQPQDEGYGITVMLGLPGGVEVMLYEPRHPMMIAPAKRKPKKRAGRKVSRKTKTPKDRSSAKARRRK